MPQWDAAKRQQVKKKLDKEADRMKARVGARTIAVIAFFVETPDAPLIMLEGGTAPMAGGQLYATLAQLYAENEAKLQAQARDQPKPNSPEPNRVQ